jgi:NADH-quinone oxidoreductase subunit A
MLEKILYSPPIVFLIALLFFMLLSALFSRLAYRCKETAGARKSYACGEDLPSHMAQPDYSQFFPFAFFFTIAHVATLMMTVVPTETFETMFMALAYLLIVLVSLTIVFKR